MLKVAIVNVGLYIRENNSKKSYWDKASGFIIIGRSYLNL